MSDSNITHNTTCQYDESQYGSYLLDRELSNLDGSLVRKDLDLRSSSVPIVELITWHRWVATNVKEKS